MDTHNSGLDECKDRSRPFLIFCDLDGFSKHSSHGLYMSSCDSLWFIFVVCHYLVVIHSVFCILQGLCKQL